MFIIAQLTVFTFIAAIGGSALLTKDVLVNLKMKERSSLVVDECKLIFRKEVY
ncbi:hypothetical protein WD019_10885 [Fictibacillus sp. Mic-4]|uniref:hypothetical protein n=1 Tax=Fictibacillus TaxID=1329200 RepID=UPI000408A766|nr:hypothetical protein [Fictibacillus gelatini]